MLLLFKEANPNFKATLFAIPGEMTQELLNWSKQNRKWIELTLHGFYHTSNYECEKMTYEEFEDAMYDFTGNYDPGLLSYFIKGFKAPGWQISDGAYQWLLENGWWVADQHYNDERRPKDLPVYHVGDNSIHTHTWDCVGNGVYELKDEILERIKGVEEFHFVSEVVK
jgi:hypothetical protein